MTSQALEEQDIGAKLLPPIAASSGALGQLDLGGIEVVCFVIFICSRTFYARYIFAGFAVVRLISGSSLVAGISLQERAGRRFGNANGIRRGLRFSERVH
jgi:hypothetical protein